MNATQLECSKCKEQKDISRFSKAKTKRGYQYICKDCSCNSQCSKVQDDTKNVNECKDKMSMNALLNCPQYDTFMKIIHDMTDDLDYEAIFKLASKKYPDNYYDIYLTLKNKFGKETPTQKVNITQSYINQYKNDANMQQVGEDIVSDDEYSIMTVRSGDKWCKVRVNKQ